MKTRNLTLKVDEATYQRARVRAAQRGTSVSAMVREFLRSQESCDPESDRIAAFEALFKQAEQEGSGNRKPVKPMTRKAIYAERLR